MREDKRVCWPKRLIVGLAYFGLFKMTHLSTVGVNRDYRIGALCRKIDFGLTDIRGLQKSPHYSPCATRKNATLIVV